MAKQVLGPQSQITVNGVDLSQWASNVTLEDSKDEVDVTGFGESYREFIPGIGDSSITVSWFQDYAASAVDATLYPLYANNTSGTVKVKANTTGTVVYTQVSKLFSFSPVSGGVGDANTIDTTFRNAGTAGLTRGTS